MDPQLWALANAASTTFVALLATDAWSTAKSTVDTFWRRFHPERAEVIEAELVDTRADLVAASEADRVGLQADLSQQWQHRLLRLLAREPAAEAELRRLLDEELLPALPTSDRNWHGDVTQRATATGHSRVYQVGQGDIHVRGDG
ncbi:hypothetical protein [Micromonospora sp. NPDC049282]|uniref:hypothetical protein n=1 Tax=Micromonospora sp. NPDC049282 TaxID=3364269 RepID=UPI003713E37E